MIRVGIIQHRHLLEQARRFGSRGILLAALLGCAACTTFGGNVSGDFACRAPGGSCAPMSSIDARAIEGVIGASSSAASGSAAVPSRLIGAGHPSGPASRTSERTLRVVFPAHVDAAGVLHDEATANIVVEGSAWTFAPKAAVVPEGTIGAAPDFEISRSPAPSSLREAIAGASAPAIEGLEFPPAQAPHPIIGADAVRLPEVPPGPTPEALAAARAGNRIVRPGTGTMPPGARGQASAASSKKRGDQPSQAKIPSQDAAAKAAMRVPELTTPVVSGLGRQRPSEPDLEAVFSTMPPTKDVPK